MKTVFIEKLVSLMCANKIDAVVLCPSKELKFITGFDPYMCDRFQGLVVKNDGNMFYICNMIYSVYNFCLRFALIC